jgi:hypothetical protein
MAVIHIESKARHIVLKELTVEHINIMVIIKPHIINLRGTDHTKAIECIQQEFT